MQKEDLRILLLSVRDQSATRREEHASFARYAGLDVSQIDVVNVFATQRLGPDIVDGYHAMFIGGASEASVLEPERYGFVPQCQELIRYCLEIDLPVFASCFGFQLAVLALGGTITRDSGDFEMGTLPIKVTVGGRSDPLFRDMPDEFLAVSVHREKAVDVPAACEVLAVTRTCIHAFRVKESNLWAFQFHPEVDRDTLVDRLTRFKDKYTQDDSHLDEILAGAAETPLSNSLVGKFVDRVLL